MWNLRISILRVDFTHKCKQRNTDGAPIIPSSLAQSANGRSEMINLATGTKKCKEENDMVFERLWNWALDLFLPIDL